MLLTCCCEHCTVLLRWLRRTCYCAGVQVLKDQNEDLQARVKELEERVENITGEKQERPQW